MTLTVQTRWLRAGGRRVPLLAGAAALDELPRALSEAGFQGRLFVVADTVALQLHAPSLREVLPETPILTISGDEADKSLVQVGKVWDWLVAERVERCDALVAFGGGVVCDLTGFAAACYLRGIGLVNAPTTLLAQVDASVGGKTGINHPSGKNLIGAFYQPICVVADTRLLTTLSGRAFASGMAEIVKIAMILDADLFARLEELVPGLAPGAADRLAPIVGRAIELKAEIVERDEREAGDRMLLNYGHTIGHALEAGAGYGTLLHGEAVAIGMRAAAYMATRLGMLGATDADRQNRLLDALNLPARWRADPEDVVGRLELDKKRAGARQRWILAEQVGRGRIRDDVPHELVCETVAALVGR
jgi:3-dehydroquinate synthase